MVETKNRLQYQYQHGKKNTCLDLAYYYKIEIIFASYDNYPLI